MQGIAASLHLQRETRPKSAVDGSPQSRPPEQVVLSFDDEYNIVAAKPIRGGGGPEKNWSPFDDCVEPRFLYSINKGALFDDQGALHGANAIVRPSAIARPIIAKLPIAPLTQPLQPEPEVSLVEEERRDRSRSKPPRIRGGDMQTVRGRRMSIDAMTSRPSMKPSTKNTSRQAHRDSDSTRLMGTGRVLLPKYDGLRGGSQLIHVGDDKWLGVGHSMTFTSGKKYYWHVFYLTDSKGKLTAASEPCKLASNGIEFAAGMAIDGDRVVISFGVDDMNAMIGETKLSAVMEILRPIAR